MPPVPYRDLHLRLHRQYPRHSDQQHREGGADVFLIMSHTTDYLQVDYVSIPSFIIINPNALTLLVRRHKGQTAC